MSNLTAEIEQLNRPSLSCAIRTLICGGYLLDKVERKPGYSIIITHKYDGFGSVQQYCFVLAQDTLNETQISAAQIAADYYKGNFVVIGQTKVETRKITWERFISLFGGPIFNSSPLETEFNNQLIELSFNRLPTGMFGEPEDLFEKYVKMALEFILGGPVIPYGQERQFWQVLCHAHGRHYPAISPSGGDFIPGMGGVCGLQNGFTCITIFT